MASIKIYCESLGQLYLGFLALYKISPLIGIEKYSEILPFNIFIAYTIGWWLYEAVVKYENEIEYWGKKLKIF